MSEVRLGEAAQELLKTLLKEIRARNGLQLTAEELISRVLEFAIRRLEEFAEEIRSLPPLDEDPAWKNASETR